MANNAGLVPQNVSGRSSQIVTTVLPANSGMPIFQAGDNFYLILATDGIEIQPFKQSRNVYSQGTGQSSPDSPFDGIQLYNTNSTNVVISLFVGFGSYIDNRLILANPLVSNISYPTAPVPNLVNAILIPDKTALPITDVNGVNYLGLQRQAIYVSNLDVSTTYYIKDTAGIVGSVLAVAPGFSVVYPAQGDFSLRPSGAGNVNCVVSEVYSAVKPTLGL